MERRHRYAEKAADDLSGLQQERESILKMTEEKPSTLVKL